MLLDEFSYWIKEEEIKAGTAMGEILSLDEEGGVGKRQDRLKATKKPLPGRVSMADVQAKAAKREAKLAERRASGGIEEITRQEEAARGPERPNMTVRYAGITLITFTSPFPFTLPLSTTPAPRSPS